ncbi:MAG: oxygen-independent coproporphyrinogen III oxidase [Burkholderiales bacterium]
MLSLGNVVANLDRSSALEVDLDLIRRLDRKGPRYTSYPTADRFVEAFDADAYSIWAAQRNVGPVRRPLSIYVHIPFCNTLCFYCGCNKIVTKDVTKAAAYLDYLFAEVRMQSALFREEPRVEQLHWGGGTPTFLTHAQMRMLMECTRESFDLAPDGEYSIEIDPRKVSEDTVALLRALGFNRMSLGVQDFEPDVQHAVNRVQSEEETERVVNAARREGFRSISIDLIYGLPKQTVMSFNRTLEKVLRLRPDRIAVYNYAHLPVLFKSQRRIREEDLPLPETKLQILGLAIRRLTDAGYLYIGMDHFALPEDELTIAQAQGRLHRNFQGYSTHADCDLVALGVSAIGKIGPTYSQNHRTLEDYYDALDRGELPVMRGIELSADDLARRAIIQSLMCHFELSTESIETAYLLDFESYFRQELEDLKLYQAEGLIDIERGWLGVTPKGRLLIRNICMVFDRYLRAGEDRARYSKVI